MTHHIVNLVASNLIIDAKMFGWFKRSMYAADVGMG